MGLGSDSGSQLVSPRSRAVSKTAVYCISAGGWLCVVWSRTVRRTVVGGRKITRVAAT